MSIERGSHDQSGENWHPDAEQQESIDKFANELHDMDNVSDFEENVYEDEVDYLEEMYEDASASGDDVPRAEAVSSDTEAAPYGQAAMDKAALEAMESQFTASPESGASPETAEAARESHRSAGSAALESQGGAGAVIEGKLNLRERLANHVSSRREMRSREKGHYYEDQTEADKARRQAERARRSTARKEKRQDIYDDISEALSNSVEKAVEKPRAAAKLIGREALIAAQNARLNFQDDTADVLDYFAGRKQRKAVKANQKSAAAARRAAAYRGRTVR